MARDDWRIRIELAEGHGGAFLERLGLGLGGEAAELARELEGRRLAVSRDGDELFVYAGSRQEAERAREVVTAELREAAVEAQVSPVERWLPAEERWEGESAEPLPAEAEAVAHGFAPWEVRIECESREEADALADRLEADGRGVVRRAHYVLVGAASEEEARELARALHGDVEAGGELVWEVAPQNPFAVFGGLGGTGTPI
jgi:hypothetical protein